MYDTINEYYNIQEESFWNNGGFDESRLKEEGKIS